MVIVLTVLTAAVVNAADGSNMCDNSGDLMGSTTLAETYHILNCAWMSAALLTRVNGRTAWSEVTAADAKSTTWTDPAAGGQWLPHSLGLFGPRCCGSIERTRFLDNSNFCKLPGDLNASSTIAGAGRTVTCAQYSPLLLDTVAGRLAWSQVTVTDARLTTWTDAAIGGHQWLAAHLVYHASHCCGGASKTRFLDDSNMCTVASDFTPAAAAGSSTCLQESSALLTRVNGTLAWSEVTQADVRLTTWTDPPSTETKRLAGLLVQFSLTCCGGSAKARFMDNSTMCKEGGDLRGSTLVSDKNVYGDGTLTCAWLSPWLLSNVGGKITWSEITAADVEETTWAHPSGKQHLSETVLLFGPRCCGSAARTRFVHVDSPTWAIVVPIVAIFLVSTIYIANGACHHERPTQQQETRPPKLGSKVGLFIATAGSYFLATLLNAVLGKVWSAAAGLELLCLPALLSITFAWQLWRWANNKACCNRARSDAKVVPERRISQFREMVQTVEAITHLQPIHAAAPRPVIAPASTPDAPFLARCKAAMAALGAELEAAGDDAQLLRAMTLHLGKRFQLCWEQERAQHTYALFDDGPLGLTVQQELNPPGFFVTSVSGQAHGGGVRLGDRIVRVGSVEPDMAQGAGAVGQIVGKLMRPFVIEFEQQRPAGDAAEAVAADETAGELATDYEAAGEMAAGEPVSEVAANDPVDVDVPASFDAAVKALLTLAMRYPASAAPLAQGAFAWHVPPLRAGGEVVVARALRSWVERTSSAADSALFSSTGLWVSPFAPFLFLICVLGSTLHVLIGVNTVSRVRPLQWSSNIAGALGCAAAYGLLRAGRREKARWAMGVGFVVMALLVAAEAVFAGCKCGFRPYADPDMWHVYHNMEAWSGSILALAILALAALSTHPHRSFELFFIVGPSLLMLLAVPDAATDNHPHSNNFVATIASTCACLTAIGTYLWTGRAHALVETRHMADEDAARYTRLWEQRLLPAAGFREALLALESAWREVQGGALRLPKRQLGAPTLCALLTHADELNDLLQAKLYDICVAHGGEHHSCGVKAEARALQKVFRSYGGDWRQLCDLCRTSLVFETIPQLEACLRAIGADAELEVFTAGDGKMRLREGFDAQRLSGGYRDIQLCVRLNCEEARARGVHEHLCEVQLHLAPIIALKSGGGHKTYVLRRNLSGR